MYIISPNEWSKVYHDATPSRKHPGEYEPCCNEVWFWPSVGTTLQDYDDGTNTFQPIAVEGIPTGRRLCKKCERLRLRADSEQSSAGALAADPLTAPKQPAADARQRRIKSSKLQSSHKLTKERRQ